MNTMKTKVVYALVAASILTFSQCNSDDEGSNPCGDLECQNGGTLVATGNGCQCDCPTGFSGDNCGQTSCIGVECPFGTSANPSNGCACE